MQDQRIDRALDMSTAYRSGADNFNILGFGIHLDCAHLDAQGSSRLFNPASSTTCRE
jgi:hypothetical protein